MGEPTDDLLAGRQRRQAIADVITAAGAVRRQWNMAPDALVTVRLHAKVIELIDSPRLRRELAIQNIEIAVV